MAVDNDFALDYLSDCLHDAVLGQTIILPNDIDQIVTTHHYLAGLWANWEYPGGRTLTTCTILTTGANALMRRVHHRMPVILPRKDWKFWLDLTPGKADLLQEMLRPAPADELLAHPVTPGVNSPDFDGPECLDPVRDDRGGQLPLF